MTTTRSTIPSSSADSPGELPAGMAWALGSGTILQGLNSAMIAVALVPIALHFGSAAALPWIVSSLYIAAAVGSPTGGRLADLFGPRRVYLVGLVIVLGASIAGPFVPSADWLIVDRVVLGLGTSLQFPAAMAILRQQASRRQAKAVGAMGIIALCGQTSAALSPTIGGLVVVIWGWEGIFWVNLPMVLNAALWVWFTVPRDERPPRVKVCLRASIAALDPLGAVLFVATLVLLMIGLLTLDTAPSWLLFTLVVPLGAVFVWRELRAKTPFFDVRLMTTHRQLALTCGRAMFTFTSFYCIFYGLPLWLEASRGLDAAQTGLLMFPVFGVGALSTIVATRLGKRMSPRVLLVVGTSAMVLAGAVLMALVTKDAPIWLLLLVSVLMGLPNGFNNLGNQLILHQSVPDRSAGAASGIYRTSQYLGAVLSTVIVAHFVTTDAAFGGIRDLGLWITALGAGMLITNTIALVRGRNHSTGRDAAE